MALKNITTGQPVSNMKNLTDQQTLIGQQAMQIYSLTSQNSQMVEKIMNLKKKLSEKENQKNIIENLNERLNDAENQLGNVKKELEKEREHNREKDKQLLETLNKLAESQAALSAGQAADKQKALAEKIIEGNKQLSDEALASEKSQHFLRKIFCRKKK